MDTKITRSGRCLCGAIKFTAKLTSHHADACHCGMCQRWSGGPLIRVMAEAGDLQISGKENLTIYSSSEWAQRAFCSQCGSHIFYRLKPTGHFGIPVGLLDSQKGLTFRSEIFIDDKSTLYKFANPTKKLTGADVMGQFATEQEKKRSKRNLHKNSAD